jgi:hypothetical protein
MNSNTYEHRNKGIVRRIKQLSIAAILLLSISLTGFAASPAEKIPSFKGSENFISAFPQATDVECKVTGEFTEVTFNWQGLKLQAFYDKEGNLAATSRPISIDNLPLTVQLNLKRQYAGYIFEQAIEFDETDNNLSYYITVIGAKASYLLRISADGTLSVFKKMKN